MDPLSQPDQEHPLFGSDAFSPTEIADRASAKVVLDKQ